MKVIVLKDFLHDKLGRVAKDTEIDIPEFQAKQLETMGIVKTYATKVVTQVAETKVVEEKIEEAAEKKRLFGKKKPKSQELE